MSEAILQAPDFGRMLKDWRHHRRMSQLGLSSHSGISQRHISFLETGRSNPSRGMVLALADTLDVPLRERNALLQSAGFAAGFSEQALDTKSMGTFQAALQATLAHHEPFPAIVLDGRWNLVMANAGALRFFGLFVDMGQALTDIGSPQNFQIARLCLHDRGLRPFIVNWEDLAWSFLQRARRALLHNPRDPHLPELIEEIVAHPQAPAHWKLPDWTSTPAPALIMTMRKDDRDYSLFTMLAHFGAAQNVTLDELSVESFYPADDETQQYLEMLGSA